MGKPVTIDADDLATLLFSTGVIKDIEQAMVGRTRDALVMQAAPKLTEAHNRLAHAWQKTQAMRPPPDPTPSQVRRLRELIPARSAAHRPGLHRDDEPVLRPFPVDMIANRDLSICGLVVFGEAFEGRKVDWSPPNGTEFIPSGAVYHVARVTPLGCSALAKIGVAIDPVAA